MRRSTETDPFVGALKKTRTSTTRHLHHYDHSPAISARVAIGAASEENRMRRLRMEDAHTVLPLLPGCSFGQQLTFMAVFDGHGGVTAAKWCGDNFHELLIKELEGLRVTGGSENDGDSAKPDDEGDSDETEDDAVEAAMEKAFEQADEKVIEVSPNNCGCTAAVCLIDWTTSKLYSANCGDARIVLYSSGDKKAVRLSYDHKGSDPMEKKRVLESGGFFGFGDRLNGTP
jgi:protein phosphatase PTC1